MVIFNSFLAIFCLCNAIHGLKDWPQGALIPSVHDVNQRLSLELKTEDDHESEELYNYNSFKKLTLLDNASSNEFTEPTTIDTTYEYNNLVLTTAIRIHKESLTSDFKNSQKNYVTKYVKGRSESKHVKKRYQSLQNLESEDGIEGKESTVGGLDSTETSTIANQFWVLTPARRIYFGHKTKIKHFPFLVTVHVFHRFACGGSIIKSNLVITAASCLRRWQEYVRLHHTAATTTQLTTTDLITTDNTETDHTETKTPSPSTNLTDTAKESSLSSSDETTTPVYHNHDKYCILAVRIGTNYYRLNGKVVKIVKVHFHPSYQHENLQDNLAIMKLERHLSFKHRNVKKIEIRKIAADVPEGTKVTIAGWGAKTYHNKIFNALWNLIQKAVLTVIERDECVETYTSKFVNNETNFCARNKHNEGACNGDAGDPAVVDGELVGVTSFGSPRCGAPNATTVFTNLGYYTEWIEEVMANDSKSNSSEESSHSKEKKKKEETTTKRMDCLRCRSPVYYSNEKYQEQNFQPKMVHWPGEYRRIYNELRDTFSDLSYSTHSDYGFLTMALVRPLLGGENTYSERDSAFLTMLPVPLTSSTQYTWGDTATEKSMSRETNAKIENNFLLTPNTPRTFLTYDMIK